MSTALGSAAESEGRPSKVGCWCSPSAGAPAPSPVLMTLRPLATPSWRPARASAGKSGRPAGRRGAGGEGDLVGVVRDVSAGGGGRDENGGTTSLEGYHYHVLLPFSPRAAQPRPHRQWQRRWGSAWCRWRKCRASRRRSCCLRRGGGGGPWLSTGAHACKEPLLHANPFCKPQQRSQFQEGPSACKGGGAAGRRAQSG